MQIQTIKRNGYFLEEKLLNRGTGNNIVDLEEIQEPGKTAYKVRTSEQKETVANGSNINTSVRRSSRTHKEPDRYLWHLRGSEVLVVAESNGEPTNYKSTISDFEFVKWA